MTTEPVLPDDDDPPRPIPDDFKVGNRTLAYASTVDITVPGRPVEVQLVTPPIGPWAVVVRLAVFGALGGAALQRLAPLAHRVLGTPAAYPTFGEAAALVVLSRVVLKTVAGTAHPSPSGPRGTALDREESALAVKRAQEMVVYVHNDPDASTLDRLEASLKHRRAVQADALLRGTA